VTPNVDLHYCKRCEVDFYARVSAVFTGTAMLKCPGCGYEHPRQFESGTAVSCDPPRGERPLKIAGSFSENPA
jgi:hypothetical protein